MKVTNTPRCRLQDAGLQSDLRDLAEAINATSEGRMTGSHNARATAPVGEKYALGDYVRNSAPAAGSYQGWVCQTTAIWLGVGQLCANKGTTAARPTKTTLGVPTDAGFAGYLYLDTTLDADGKPIWWSGTAWVDATGAVV
jgi:hypothetical protein